MKTPELLNVRCDYCGKLLGKVCGIAEIKCTKCGRFTLIDTTAPENKRTYRVPREPDKA